MLSFPTPEASYLWNAAHLADWAGLAYPAHDQSPLDDLDPSQWVRITSGQDTAIVAWNKTECVIAVAGTDDVLDWADNLNWRRLTDVGPFRVHPGFWDGAKRIARELDQIDAWRSRRCWGAHHSKGAGVGCLLPIRMAKLNPHATATFGAPRCISSDTAWKYEHPTWRFVSPQDVVPDVPLHFTALANWVRGVSYSHVPGPCLYVNGRIDTETNQVLRRIIRTLRYGNSVRRMLASRSFQSQAVADHTLDDLYRPALAQFKSAHWKHHRSIAGEDEVVLSDDSLPKRGPTC